MEWEYGSNKLQRRSRELKEKKLTTLLLCEAAGVLGKKHASADVKPDSGYLGFRFVV
jgi:hypothetical protein